MLLRDWTTRGRVPGAIVGTVDEAIDYLRELSRENEGDPSRTAPSSYRCDCDNRHPGRRPAGDRPQPEPMRLADELSTVANNSSRATCHGRVELLAERNSTGYGLNEGEPNYRRRHDGSVPD